MASISSPFNSLRTFLLTLFVVQVLVASGLTGYISYRHSVQTVDEMAGQLCAEIMSRVEQHLDSYLTTAQSINRINVRLAGQGLLDVDDTEKLSLYFWEQGQVFPGFGTVAFADSQGNFVGANEPENYIVIADKEITGGSIRRYAPTEKGYISGTILREKKNYDARKRGWYQKALAAGEPTWTEINTSVTGARLDLTATAPFYDNSGTFRGIFLTDVSLSNLADFLHRLQIGTTGQVFIVEENWNLVAASFTEPLSVAGDKGADRVTRVPAAHSKSRLIAGAAQFLSGKDVAQRERPDQKSRSFTLDNKKYFLQTASYHRKNTNFLTVVVLPEADFMTYINRSSKIAVILVGVAVGIALLLGFWMSSWVINPIRRFSESAKALGKGDLDTFIEVERNDEVGELARVFNSMAANLKVTIDELRHENENRQNTETTLLETLNLAEDEKEKTKAIIAAIGDGISIQDREMRVIYQNEIHKKMVGNHQGEYCFKAFEHQEDVCDQCPVAKSFADGGIHTVERNVPSADGIKYFEITTSPIRDASGEITAGIEVVRDVTTRKRAEQELLKIRKLESVGTLAGGIAHDFNNILVAILGNLNLAAQMIDKKHTASPILEDAVKASIRARGLTTQLLTFAKGGNPVKELSSVADVIRESARFVLHGAKSNCVFSIPDDLWLVDIDKGQIGQVVQNIIINAQHAMPEGGTIHVSCENIIDQQHEGVRLDTDRNYIKITIRDKGIGIPENLVEKIFDPYFTTKKEGSGLGLSISHSIVNKHMGSITVSSKPGRGTSFHIYLPASEKTAAMDKTKEDDNIYTEVEDATVLLMDDDEMVRQVSGNMLMFMGYRVIQAQDGQEAIDLYKKSCTSREPIDIIIMDLTIPGGMGGQEAVKEILKINPEAKVIVSSGYSTDPILAEYRKYGFKGAIVKPFDLQGMRSVIEKVLHESDTRQGERTG